MDHPISLQPAFTVGPHTHQGGTSPSAARACTCPWLSLHKERTSPSTPLCLLPETEPTISPRYATQIHYWRCDASRRQGANQEHLPTVGLAQHEHLVIAFHRSGPRKRSLHSGPLLIPPFVRVLRETVTFSVCCIQGDQKNFLFFLLPRKYILFLTATYSFHISPQNKNKNI